MKGAMINRWNAETAQWETYCARCNKLVLCINRAEMAVNNTRAEARQENAVFQHLPACGGASES